MIDTSNFTRYTHPSIVTEKLSNVRIIDFSQNVNNKTTAYGAMSFGEDENGTLTADRLHTYIDVQYLKYWKVGSGWNHFYRTDNTDAAKNIGDFFVTIWHYIDGTASTIDWYLNSSISIFGTYAKQYSFSGLHRIFLPHNVLEQQPSHFNIYNNHDNAFIFGGYTLPINYALMNNGYQTTSGTTGITGSTLDVAPDVAVASVTSAACEGLKTSFPNAKVYVIKYGTDNSALDSCGTTVKTYSANSESTLIEKLHEIANDIKDSTTYKGPVIETNEESYEE
jgi:hypothetical protein